MKVTRITLRKGRDRTILVVESSLDVDRPQVGETVTLSGDEGWRVSRVESVEVLARFPGIGTAKGAGA